jgi:hypothetical protein
VVAAAPPDEAAAFLGASLAEASAGDTAISKTVRLASRRRAGDNASDETDGDGLPEISVMASGCLGLISFPRQPGRLTLERIDELHPGLVGELAGHPGVGFVLVHSDRRGPLVIGAHGIHALDAGTVDGEDPLGPFGPHAAAHVRRTSGFPHCPDILVNSTYWEDTDEVAAFEELVGSHGGLGGSQSFPFLLYPVELEPPGEPLVGAEAVHRQLRRWLVQLGHERYSDPAPGLAAAQAAKAG